MTRPFELEMICEFASRDTSKALLNSVTFDDIGLAVATDGYRLFASKELYHPIKAGKTFSICDLEEKGQYNEIKGTALDWKALFKTMDRANYRHNFSLSIPEWFSSIKNESSRIHFTIDFQNTEDPKILIGDFPNDFSFVIDGRFLAPFHGKDILITVDNYKTPIIITPKNELIDNDKTLLQELKNFNWFALIMPFLSDKKVLSTKKTLFV